MSRCYPFPPPGYEKKNIIGDVDVLSKEKHKEKKHKRDKNREKKDGKVKKDKDRSKEKSKEKKDCRENHEHKKERKEGSRDKEKKPEVHLNSVNGVRVNSNSLQTEYHNSGNPNHAEELARRIKVEGQATGSQIGHENTATDEGKANGMINSNDLPVVAKRGVEKDKNASGGPILQKIRHVDQAKAQMHTRSIDRNGCFFPEPNQTGNSRQVDQRTANGAMDPNHLQNSAKRMVEKEKNGLRGQIAQKIIHMDQTKVKFRTRTDDGSGCFSPEPNGKEKSTQGDGRAVNGTMDSSHLQVSAERSLVKERNGLGGQIVQKIRFMDQKKAKLHTRTDDGNGCFAPEPNGKEKGTEVDGRAINGTMDSSHFQRSLVKEKNGLGGQIVQEIRLVDQTKVKLHMKTDDGNGCFSPEPNGKENGSQVDNRAVNGTTMDSSHLQVVVKRSLAKEKNGFGGQIVQKTRLGNETIQIHKRSDDGNDFFVPDPNVKEKGVQADNRIVNGGRNLEEATNAKSVVAYQGIAKPSEAMDVKIDPEGTGKSKYNRESNYKMGKHKSKDRDKKSELKDKVGDKEKKKEDKAKEKGERSNGQSKAIKGGFERNGTCSVNLELNGQSKAISGKIVAREGDLGKRKEPEINGCVHENGGRPHKLHRPVASSPTNPQNGMKSEACQTEKRRTDSDVAGLKNALIEAPPHKVSSKGPLPTAKKASKRPPHPDSMLLDRILSLPELDRTPNFDDQEWLLCNTSHPESLKMLETDSSEGQVVWNHATRIEYADIFALPYVVPY